MDNHVHSVYSECCNENYNLETIINKQAANGMKYACVTDHIHSIDDTGGLAGHFSFIRTNPEALKKIDVFIGAELTFIDDEGNVPLPFLSGAERPDFLIGGCHSVGSCGVSMSDINTAHSRLAAMTDNEFTAFTDEHLHMLKGAVQKGIINILAHPLDIFFRCRIYDSRLLESFQEIARICRKKDIAVEINNASAERCLSSGGNGDDFNKYSIRPEVFYMKMINIARDEGVIFSTGSDAHTELSIGDMKYAEIAVKKAGIDHSRLLSLDSGVDFKRYLSGNW